MADFSYLNKLEVKDKTAEYPLYELEGAPVLIVKHAGESNRGYLNGLMILTGNGNIRKLKNSKLDNNALELVREQDRELYPEHVIIGWKNVKDTEGNDVEFNKENATGFIQALPNWIFDGVRTFATSPSNFINQIDTEEKAGN